MHPPTTCLSLTNLQLLLSLTSFFHGLALVRTFSNSMETSLTTLALSYWLPITNPLHPKKLEETKDLRPPSIFAALKLILPLSIAALACAIRPTNAVLWTYLVGTYVFNLRKQPIQIAQTLFVAGLVGYDFPVLASHIQLKLHLRAEPSLYWRSLVSTHGTITTSRPRLHSRPSTSCGPTSLLYPCSMAICHGTTTSRKRIRSS